MTGTLGRQALAHMLVGEKFEEKGREQSNKNSQALVAQQKTKIPCSVLTYRDLFCVAAK